jgi:hypothetical protein
MPAVLDRKELEDLQQDLRVVQALLERQRIVESLVARQPGRNQEPAEGPGQRQHLVELRAKLDEMHAADIAFILEALPLDDRLAVWDLVKSERDGEILLEVSDAVRESLIRDMARTELVAAAETLDADEIADLAADLPQDVIQDIFRALPVEEREQTKSFLAQSLLAVVTQVLVKTADGRGRKAICEIMVMTKAIAKLIQSDQTHQVPSQLQTGRDLGMQMLDQSLLHALQAKEIDPDDAYAYASDKRMFQKFVTDTSILPKLEATQTITGT